MLKLKKFKEKKLTNKNKILSFAILVFLMTIVISINYAYSFYNAKVKEDNKTESTIISKKLGLIFNDKTNLNVPHLEPGGTVQKKFEVVSDADDSLKYNVKFVNIFNSYQEDVIYRLYKDGEKVIDNTSLPKTSDYSYIYNNVSINPKEKHEYILEIEYLIYEDKLQKRDLTNEFRGTIEIDTEEYTVPNCVISGIPTSWTKSTTLTINKDENNDNIYSWDSLNFSSNKTKIIDTNGTYTAYVKNKFGIVETCSVTVNKMDATPPSKPTLTLKLNNNLGSEYVSGNWTNANVYVELSSNDAESGIDHYEWYENGWTTRAILTTNGINSITYTTPRNETIRFRAIDKAGNISGEESVLIRIDKESPSLNLVSGTYDIKDTTSIVSSSKFGLSGGNVSCFNNSRGNNVSKISDIATLGVSSITCTATSLSGIKTIKSTNITLNTTLTYGNGLYYTGNAVLSGNTIKLNNGGVQYGPYYNMNKGCYRVTYSGNNLNTNPVLAIENANSLNFRAYTNGTDAYTLYTFNYVSANVIYGLKIPSNVNSVETTVYNLTQTQVSINNVKIEYTGTNC